MNHSTDFSFFSNMSKKTLVLGASLKPERYSHMAVKSLLHNGFPVIAIGRRQGWIEDIPVSKDLIYNDDIHTVTLYMNASNQSEFLQYILDLHPQRIIFNPGTENPALERAAREKNIETVHGCTLVMLSTGQY